MTSELPKILSRNYIDSPLVLSNIIYKLQVSRNGSVYYNSNIDYNGVFITSMILYIFAAISAIYLITRGTGVNEVFALVVCPVIVATILLLIFYITSKVRSIQSIQSSFNSFNFKHQNIHIASTKFPVFSIYNISYKNPPLDFSQNSVILSTEYFNPSYVVIPKESSSKEVEMLVCMRIEINKNKKGISERSDIVLGITSDKNPQLTFEQRIDCTGMSKLGFEDGRIFTYKDAVYITGTTDKHEFGLLKLDTLETVVKSLKSKNKVKYTLYKLYLDENKEFYNTSPVQKNWSALVCDDVLYFLIDIDPLCIVRPHLPWKEPSHKSSNSPHSSLYHAGNSPLYSSCERIKCSLIYQSHNFAFNQSYSLSSHCIELEKNKYLIPIHNKTNSHQFNTLMKNKLKQTNQNDYSHNFVSLDFISKEMVLSKPFRMHSNYINYISCVTLHKNILTIGYGVGDDTSYIEKKSMVEMEDFLDFRPTSEEPGTQGADSFLWHFNNKTVDFYFSEINKEVVNKKVELLLEKNKIKYNVYKLNEIPKNPILFISGEEFSHEQFKILSYKYSHVVVLHTSAKVPTLSSNVSILTKEKSTYDFLRGSSLYPHNVHLWESSFP